MSKEHPNGTAAKFIAIAALLLVGWAIFATYQWRKPWGSFTVRGPLTTQYVVSGEINGVPATVYIGNESWEIIPVASFKGKATGAQTYCDENVITYLPANDRLTLREDLWHEIFHAGACRHGGDEYWNSLKPTSTQHPGIYHLGEFMATFVHDNPNFAVWAAN